MQNEQIAFVSTIITDIKGALDLLAARADGRDYSPDTLHSRVKSGNLPAYVFVGTELVRWDRDNAGHRGKEYIFLKSDIQEMPLVSKAGRKKKPDKKSNSENSAENGQNPSEIA
jgi:hypothetical protein